MSDYHLHLHPHGDEADGPPLGEYPPGLIESYVETAASRGVTEVGFTEHLYRCHEGADVLGPFWEREGREDLAAQAKQMMAIDAGLSLDRYVEAIVSAKDRGLPVKLGLEVDFFPDTIGAVMGLLGPYPFDFLIGSVHWVGGWSIDSGDVIYEFDRRGISQAWADYFALVTDLAASGTVDVLAHVDVCKKFGLRPRVEPLHLYQEVIEAAVRSGTAVEVSSQGLRRPVAEIYPSPVFLRMFHEAGVAITLASDAHRPAEAGHAHDLLVRAARAAGYTDHLRFESRRSYRVPLP
ncbi:MAG TPA: histidinol-phosphatase HisJ family protein [Acidimicrobiia bacterium]|nr:histidinol-phosphatase HisJ family protein [Acidimicrobiia bacterium]